MTIRIARAGAENAALIRDIMRAAFAEYVGVLRPPSSAPDETIEDVAAAIARGGGVLAWEEASAVGTGRFEPRDGYLYVGRLAVLPTHRGRGIASAMMGYMEDIGREMSLPRVEVGVRMSLPRNLELYRRLGYDVVRVEAHPRGPDQLVTLAKRL